MSQAQLTTTQTKIPRRLQPPGPHYKWIALSNTTLGMLMATINSSIVLISLPAIFNGIGINPLGAGETNYLLWMLMGYMLLTATLVVSLGRISDMFGRVRLYNLGFAIFSLGSILLYITPGRGNGAAIMMIAFRLVQAVGGSFLMANSTPILMDAFPVKQRGMAMGINQLAVILGSVLGLILGGILSAIDWRLVFLVSVPVGVAGTIWAFLMLRETTQGNAHQKIDWFGNITFFLGLTIALIGMTYGLEPYGSSAMGWGNPFVISCLVIGVVLLILFVWIEMRSRAPMFDLHLFKIVSFAAGNIANFCAGLVRGGLQFMLIIWLQGIWLPLHGYNFADTPLWAGIYMLPLMVGFIVIGPVSGILSDKLGQRLFATTGMSIQAICFVLLTLLPANFDYIWFAVLLAIMGLGQGMFSAPNTTLSMNDVPSDRRGVGSGMRVTFMNAASVISMTMFFSIVTAGLASALPSVLSSGLLNVGLPATIANSVAKLPPIAALFAAFLGYNPMQSMLPAAVLQQLPATAQSTLLGQSFFPNLLSSPFMDGMRLAFYLAAGVCVVAAVSSTVRGKRVLAKEEIVEAGTDVLGIEESMPAPIRLPVMPQQATQMPAESNGHNGWQPATVSATSQQATQMHAPLESNHHNGWQPATAPVMPQQATQMHAPLESNGHNSWLPATAPVTPATASMTPAYQPQAQTTVYPLQSPEVPQQQRFATAVSQLLAVASEANVSLNDIHIEIERQKVVDEERKRYLTAAVSQLLTIVNQFNVSLSEVYAEIDRQQNLHLQAVERREKTRHVLGRDPYPAGRTLE
ncbi:MAG TPA: MFS transporter [Ktedonobacteraceae bacterium]|nr:MFS transporter [Ktedonobacteraceae bacterium]